MTRSSSALEPGAACCSQLSEHRHEQREDFADVWNSINEVRGKVGELKTEFFSFKGYMLGIGAILAIEIPVALWIAAHWR